MAVKLNCQVFYRPLIWYWFCSVFKEPQQQGLYNLKRHYRWLWVRSPSPFSVTSSNFELDVGTIRGLCVWAFIHFRCFSHCSGVLCDLTNCLSLFPSLSISIHQLVRVRQVSTSGTKKWIKACINNLQPFINKKGRWGRLKCDYVIIVYLYNHFFNCLFIYHLITFPCSLLTPLPSDHLFISNLSWRLFFFSKLTWISPSVWTLFHLRCWSAQEQSIQALWFVIISHIFWKREVKEAPVLTPHPL